MVPKVCRHLLRVAIETVTLDRRPDTVLAGHVGRRGSHRALGGLATPRTATSDCPCVVVLCEIGHKLVRALMLAICPQQSHGLVVVPGDRRAEILVTALGQAVDVHVQDAFSLRKLLLL